MRFSPSSFKETFLDAQSFFKHLSALDVKIFLQSLSVCRRRAAGIYREHFEAILSGREPSFPWSMEEWVDEITGITQEAGLEVEWDSDFSPLGPDERGIVIANHPTTGTIFPTLSVMTKMITRNLIAVAKDTLISSPVTGPLFGRPISMAGMILPIPRKNRKGSLEAIDRECRARFKPGTALMIFPDGRRPTPRCIESERKWAKKKFPETNANEWLLHTAFPRSGGLMAILEAAKRMGDSIRLRIFKLTVGNNKNEYKEGLSGTTFRVKGQEVPLLQLIGESSDPAANERHLQGWLVDEWRETNDRISLWRSRI